jgi:predicted acylesterase/phospholipase RssA
MRALSLPGCGCRGAFQFGVLRRLVEAGERFDLVAGASSGSICGAAHVAGLSLDGPDVYRTLSSTPVFSRRWLASEGSPFGMSWIVRDALSRFIPLDRIVSSDVELLVSTTRLEPFARNVLREWRTVRAGLGAVPFQGSPIHKVARGNGALVVHSSRSRPDMHDVIVASCTIPIVYARLPRLDGEIHVDGGAADNTLIDVLVERGATEVTVITPYEGGAVSPTLFEASRPPSVAPHVRLRLISPQRPIRLGRFDFDRGRLEEALSMPHVETIIEPGQPLPSVPDGATSRTGT